MSIMNNKLYFGMIELTGFILPAFPDAFSMRLSILLLIVLKYN